MRSNSFASGSFILISNGRSFSNGIGTFLTISSNICLSLAVKSFVSSPAFAIILISFANVLASPDNIAADVSLDTSSSPNRSFRSFIKVILSFENGVSFPRDQTTTDARFQSRVTRLESIFKASSFVCLFVQFIFQYTGISSHNIMPNSSHTFAICLVYG